MTLLYIIFHEMFSYEAKSCTILVDMDIHMKGFTWLVYLDDRVECNYTSWVKYEVYFGLKNEAKASGALSIVRPKTTYIS